MAKRSPRSRGFTLIELMVVIAIIGMLAGLLIPVIGRVQERARRTQCATNVRGIGMALLIWGDEHDGRFPPAVDPADPTEPARVRFAHLVKEGYIKNPKLFICPGRKDHAVPDDYPQDRRNATLAELVLDETGCSYGWDPEKSRTADEDVALVADIPNDEGGRNGDSPAGKDGNSPNHKGEGQNVFYLDSSVAWTDTPESSSRADDNIYSGDAANNSTYDANIDR